MKSVVCEEREEVSDMSGYTTEGVDVTTDLVVTTAILPSDEENEYYRKLSELIFLIIIPFITIIGIVGNIISLIVMSRPSLRSSSVSVFISSLAVVDSLVLLLDFLQNWVDWMFDLDILKLSNAGCVFYRYIFDTTYTYAAWLVVSLAVERFIVVWFPFKARTLCTYRVAVVTSCILPVVIGSIYAYELFMWELDDMGECNIHKDYIVFMSSGHPWVTGTLYSYAPIAILVFCTSGVVIQLSLMKRRRSNMSSKQKEGNNHEIRVTLMVVMICVLFLLLTVPLTAFYVILFAAGQFVYAGPEMALVRTFILILALTNHAYNFFLYVLSSQKFRSELKMLPCWHYRCVQTQNEQGSSYSGRTNDTKLSSRPNEDGLDVSRPGDYRIEAKGSISEPSQGEDNFACISGDHI